MTFRVELSDIGRMTPLILLVALCLSVEDKPLVFDRVSQVDEIVVLPQHIELVRGRFLENSANVRAVLDKTSAIMRCDFAKTTSRTDYVYFVIKGVDTTGWEVGDVKQLPKPLKVTGWHKYKSGGSNVEVQILEPLRKP